MSKEPDIGLEDKIDQYLMGEMEDAEREDFEKQMEGELSLKAAVEFRKQVMNEVVYLNEAKSIIRRNKRSYGFVKLMVAASILVLVSVLIWQPMKLTNEAIISQYAHTSPKGVNMEEKMNQLDGSGVEDLHLRGDECFFGDFRAEECRIVFSAMVAYGENNYDQFIELLRPIDNLEKKSLEISLFYAIALIKKQHAKDAIEILLKVGEGSGNDYIDDVNYYIGLAYLANNQRIVGRRFLKKIEPESMYYPDAKKILRDSKRF
jgi:hypothetical protein